jgi:ribonuclease T1
MVVENMVLSRGRNGVKRVLFRGCGIALAASALILSGCHDQDQNRDARTQATGKSGASAVVEAFQPTPSEQKAASSQVDSASRETFSGGTVKTAELPKQAVATLRKIEAGGPFPFEKDGIVFGNRERALPAHPRGFYREYTVPTPRARNRGARRIVCGGPRRQIDNCFYSDDHYASFKRIAG